MTTRQRQYDCVLSDLLLFERLFRDHGTAIFRFCLRRTGDPAIADDHRSTVFVEAWRRRNEVDLTTEEALPWLYGVAANVMRNHLRSHRRGQAAFRRLPLHSAEHDVTDEITSRIDASDQARAALALLKTFSPGERDVVLLCLGRDLSYRAAASALEVPIGTVRSRLSRARARLTALAPTEQQNDPSAASTRCTVREADGDRPHTAVVNVSQA
jgi:RNA polymerase sigma-70 factor (ECF subfamily)